MPRADTPSESPEEGDARPAFVELPTGIFTAAGTWFHVSARDLEAYAGPLLERVPLERLLATAETVLRGPQTLTAWMLLVVLLAATPVEAAASGALLFLAWSVIGPGLVLPGLPRALRVLEQVWLQGLAYVAGLSLLAAGGAPGAVWVGLAGFVLLRWGVLERLVDPLAARMRSRLYALPLPDQVLRAVMVRSALRERVSLPQIDRIESDMLRLSRRRSRGSGNRSDD